MASFTDISDSLTFALPDLSATNTPASRQERIQMILDNLKQHHAHVRTKIISAAATALDRRTRPSDEHLESPASPPPDDDADTMDLDTASMQTQDDALLIANLSAAYDPSQGDPRASPHISNSNGRPQLQESPDEEIRAAKAVFDQLEMYDRHARGRLQFYLDALERERRRGSLPAAAAGQGGTSAGRWDVQQ